jgi:hypothetical protein
VFRFCEELWVSVLALSEKKRIHSGSIWYNLRDLCRIKASYKDFAYSPREDGVGSLRRSGTDGQILTYSKQLLRVQFMSQAARRKYYGYLRALRSRKGFFGLSNHPTVQTEDIIHRIVLSPKRVRRLSRFPPKWPRPNVRQ